MRATWSSAAAVALGLLSLGSLAIGQTTTPKYHAAVVSQAGTVPFPLNTRTPGIVSVDVAVSSSGAAQNVVVVRDLPPLTAAVVSAVKGWSYTAATANGDSVSGIVPIAVAFNPYNPSGVGLPAQSLQPAQAQVVSNFQPPGVVQASYANYPPNTVASGTVVLKVHVSSSGRVHDVSVVQGIDALNAASITAAKTWEFSPAMYKGKPVSAEVVIAFVYAAPQEGTR
jgi:TonB family protein